MIIIATNQPSIFLTNNYRSENRAVDTSRSYLIFRYGFTRSQFVASIVAKWQIEEIFIYILLYIYISNTLVTFPALVTLLNSYNLSLCF